MERAGRTRLGGLQERGGSFNVDIISCSQLSRQEKDGREYSRKDITAKESADTEYRLEVWKRKGEEKVPGGSPNNHGSPKPV